MFYACNVNFGSGWLSLAYSLGNYFIHCEVFATQGYFVIRSAQWLSVPPKWLKKVRKKLSCIPLYHIAWTKFVMIGIQSISAGLDVRYANYAANSIQKAIASVEK